jgi:RimJ/RimL family protein N-acetyltransferase
MAELIPRLETASLILRGISEEHAESYERNFADYEVVRWLIRAVPWPYPAGGVLEWMRAEVLPVQGRERWVWGIFRREDERECIGAVDVLREGRPEQRGFWLARPFWRRGYMTEATDAVTDYVFDELGFDKLVLSNAVGNVASSRLKQKAGARLLRVVPFDFVDPALRQREVWELTREDWKRSRA